MTSRASLVTDVHRPLVRLAAVGCVLVAATAVAPALHLTYGGWTLVLIFAISGAGAVFASRPVDLPDQRRAVTIILAGAIAMRLVLLFVEPYLSTDIYRYIWDGRVQAAGINPYRYVPSAPELAHLRDAAIFPNINRADYAVTIYPPFAQAFFLAVTRFGESVAAMKLGLIACEAGIVAAILVLLRRQGSPATRVAAYAWHPLPIWEIAGSGHVDALMCAALLAGLLLFFHGQALLAAVLVTLGALVKPTALLALPVFWRPWDWRMPVVVLLTAVCAYLPYLSVGRGVIGFLPGYLDEEGMTSGHGIGVLWLLEQAVGRMPGALTAYVVVAALLLVGLATAAAFRRDGSDATAIRYLSWLLIAFLTLASPHYPWYFLVLVPFLAISASSTGWLLTLASPLIYDSIAGTGWPDYSTRIALFTLATLAALAHDALRARRQLRPQVIGAIP